MADNLIASWGFAGTATMVQVDATTAEETQDANLILMDAGGPPPDGDADGDTITATLSIISGVASEVVVAPGDTITLTASISDEGTAGVSYPLDGSKILEFTGQTMPSTVYFESDYHSIYSLGDRGTIPTGNNLIAISDAGWGTTFGNVYEMIDDGYAFPLGNGFTYGGTGTDPGPEGATVRFSFQIGQQLTGIKFIGNDSITAADTYALYGGIDGIVFPEPLHPTDAFIMGQGPSTDPLHTNEKYSALEFDPETFIPWPDVNLVYVGDAPTAGRRLANEIHFKVLHSILDGGNRMPTNGRPEKQVLATVGPGWFERTGSTYQPLQYLMDGDDLHSDGGSSHAYADCNIGSIAGASTPMSTVGAYLQFVFPRPVYPFQMVFQSRSGTEEYDSGGEPTVFGKWHWEISNNGGSTWFAVGSSWKFCENARYALAPHDGSVFDLTPGSGGLNEDGATHWRMVLDAGPAFGGGVNLRQIMFNLWDVSNQGAPLTLAFTDDTDTAYPTLTVTGLSPYTVDFKDGSDDKLDATATIINNPIMSVAFSDAEEDGLTAIGSFYPSRVVQTTVVATGRP